jgi:NAD(P)-dependent dehydrogenase (short-subunit alcohol dehydrogenase family)
MVERAAAAFDGLDMLFNNAGIGMGGEPEELTLAHWERTIDVNLRGVLHGCHAAYPLMKRQGFGRIINTASLAGLGAGIGTLAPYNTTKYGVVGLSLSLRAAGADAGVGVHVVCPGAIDTPVWDKTNPPDVAPIPSVEGIDPRALMSDLGFKNFYEPGRCAADILRGVARNRPIIVVPRQARNMWMMLRLSPALADILALRATRIARKHGAPAGRPPATPCIVPP